MRCIKLSIWAKSTSERSSMANNTSSDTSSNKTSYSSVPAYLSYSAVPPAPLNLLSWPVAVASNLAAAARDSVSSSMAAFNASELTAYDSWVNSASKAAVASAMAFCKASFAALVVSVSTSSSSTFASAIRASNAETAPVISSAPKYFNLKLS